MSLSINVESATKCTCAFLQSIEMGRSKRIGNGECFIVKLSLFEFSMGQKLLEGEEGSQRENNGGC